MTSDCQVDPAFQNQCAANGGTVTLASEDGRVVPKCGCPVGTKQLANGTCKSIACLFPTLTCKEICSNGKLREDQRCCQNWKKDRCNELPKSGTFCEPGTIWNETDKSCTNACAANKSEPVCEHGCTYINLTAPAYQCKCQDDELLSPDGLDCRVKSNCSDPDVQICSREGRLCSVENGKMRCKCPENTLEGPGYCSDKQYKYVVSFKRRDFQGPSSSRGQCGDLIQDEVVINRAMKNLYGLQLEVARIVNCSTNVTKIELTFNEDPSTAVLQRIHLCENGSPTCSFPPSLLIEKGSVSGPVAIDLCHTNFEKLGAISNGTHRCSNRATDPEQKDCGATWVDKATIAAISVSVACLAIVVFVLLVYCCKRLRPCRPRVENREYNPVRYRVEEKMAEDGEPAIELLPQQCDTNPQRRQNSE